MRRQDDGSGHHRAGKRAPTDLVDPGDALEAEAGKFSFVVESGVAAS
jgi:hypothetical protein